MANLATLDVSSPVSLLERLPGWETLNRKDQIAVEKETRALGDSFTDFGRARLSMGEHLSNIHDRLGSAMFHRYIDLYNLKRSTAYNHMKAYKNAVEWLPGPVLQAAMTRNMPIMGIDDDKPLGTYTDPVKRLPPPKTDDPVKIHQYLDSIEESRKKARARSSRKVEEAAVDFDALTVESYRYVSLRLNKVSSRQRRKFLTQLVGYLLTEIGVSGSQSFEAEGIPDGFRAQVGRPRKEEDAA